jgi:small subunit ribosomal protein S20
MPTTSAAAKAHRQNIKAHARNKAVKDQLKKFQVHLRKAITAGDKAQVTTIIKDYTRAIDKAAQKKMVGRNTAARKKSRLAALARRS